MNADGKSELKEKPKDKTKLWLLAYLVSMVMFVVLKILAGFNVFKFMGDSASDIINVSIQVLIIGLIPLGIVLFKVKSKESLKQTFQNFNYKSVSIKTVLLSILIGICCYIGVVLISSAFSGFLYVVGWRNPFILDDRKMSVGLFIFSIFSTAILPAVCEEFLNRGVLFSSLKKFGVKKAIVFSSVCFGLMHFNVTQVHYAIIIGFVLSYLMCASRSIWPAIIVHFTNNFLSVLFSFLHDNKYFGYQVYEGFFNFIISGDVFSVMIKCGIVMVLIYSLIIFLISKIFVIEKRRSLLKRLNEMKAEAKAFEGDEYIKIAEEVKKEYSLKNIMKAGNLTNYILNIHLEDELKQKELFKKDYVSKTMLYSIIILSSLLTLFTFIWGLL